MRKKTKQKLTEQLRQAVRDSGRTLGELARETGIDKSALSRFVNGKRGLSMEAIDAIGDCLELRLIADKPRAKKENR
ncbi:MAG: helix-turn-helix transcriptional regulator [Planctomycetia bacterium]